jgi:predicted nuclease of predicted toxin-antitoxin system
VRIKTDENIARWAVELLRSAAHDVETVLDQGFSGRSDEDVFAVCRSERRILMTLDRGFGELLRFPSEQSAGIVVLELGAPATLKLLTDRIRHFLALADTREINGELWIVEPGRIRIRGRDDE